jgi:hypothetical protein
MTLVANSMFELKINTNKYYRDPSTPSNSNTATVIALVPMITAGSGSILNKTDRPDNPGSRLPLSAVARFGREQRCPPGKTGSRRPETAFGRTELTK